jgi:hypothetical protein
MRSKSEPIPSGLVVIARDATGQIVTRITSNRDLMGALHTARSVLKLKRDVECVEVHHAECSASEYRGKPLALVSREDLPSVQRSV